MIFKLYERTMRPLISKPSRGVLALVVVAL
jgi:hypothetical protein